MAKEIHNQSAKSLLNLTRMGQFVNRPITITINTPQKQNVRQNNMMNPSNPKYILDKNWLIVLKDLGISAQDILRHARLPLDLISQKQPSLTADEYLRLWEAFQYMFRDEPAFPLRLARLKTVEAFSPPIFACFCSPDLNVALNRIAYYKPIVGPMRLDVTQNSEHTSVGFRGLPQNAPLPTSMIAFELAFWVHIARLATREEIIPKAIYTTVDIPEVEDYEAYFGTSVMRGEFNGLTFTAEDARRPFLTANDQMWEIFEPTLNKRMQDLERDATFRDRVRACLMEILASGKYSMADVASRLAVSTRTLQRRLRDENTNFQKELDNLREELARNYLSKTDYSSGQIAFLLGYEEATSFYRAFRSWTGETPEVIRAAAQGN